VEPLAAQLLEKLLVTRLLTPGLQICFGLLPIHLGEETAHVPAVILKEMHLFSLSHDIHLSLSLGLASPGL